MPYEQGNEVALACRTDREEALNYCRSCSQDFGSVAAFDAHRVGKHEYTFSEGLRREPPVEDGRRCLDTEEMEAKGFETNKRGRWSLTASLERGRQMASIR